MSATATESRQIVFRVLSVNGDDRFSWDRRFLDQVHEARAKFYDMRKNGYAAYLPGSGGGRGRLVTEFDPDAEGYGINDGRDSCRLLGHPDQRDSDGDGTGNDCDNCPDKFNDGQADADQDHFGDACDDRPNDEFRHGPNDGPFLPPVFPICGGGFFLAAVALGLTMTGLTLFGMGWMRVRRQRRRRR